MSEELLSVLEELRQNFRLVDAFDIAVITLLVYGILVWFRQTASRSVAIGISGIVLLYFAARTFDMYLTSLVFQTSFAVVLVALVILFQEDIRRLFERMVDWGGMGKQRSVPSARLLPFDTLVEACFEMAEQKVGALIVLMGREPLLRHVHGGIPLAGRLTAPLLYSIFDSHSAGHDGAVIVDRDRIDKFAAHLPISKNHEEIGRRGTRHAAALGLSECSDALTIVVSEERGTVSVAEFGKLIEVETGVELIDSIERFYDDRFPAKMDALWKRFFTRHIWLKLLSLLLAVTGWCVLAFNVERIQTTVLVPIEYRNIPMQAQVDEVAPVDAYVTLSGSELSFRLVDMRALKISVDLTGVTDSEIIPLTADSVENLPSNLRVDRIEPEAIIVQLRKADPVPAEPETADQNR